MDDLDIPKFRQDLLRDLRMELGHLKNCQNVGIGFALPSAGVILGLIAKSEETGLLPYFALLPLLILLPFWFIFFDKSRTIARLKGYCRIQEKLLVTGGKEALFGWETAMEAHDAIMGKRTVNNHNSNKLTSNQSSNSQVKKKKSSIINENKWESLLYVTYSLAIFIIFFIYTFLCLILSIQLKFHKISFENTWYFFPYFFAFLGIVWMAFGKKYTEDPDTYQKKLLFVVLLVWLIQIVIIFLLSSQAFKYLLIFNCSLALYMITFGLSSYLIKNLIKGRYTVNRYEKRWCNRILKIKKIEYTDIIKQWEITDT